MTAKIIKIFLVMVMVASLTGCLGQNEKPVLFCCSAEEVPADDGDVMYEVHELPQSGMFILFPKKPAEVRGAN